LAFQLQDDLLDAYGTEAQLGKPIGGDVLEGKKSFLMLTALTKADSETKQALTALLNDKQMAAQEKIAAVLKIYDRLNVRELTDKEISLHFGKAMEALDNLAADRERTEPLRQLAEGLLNRKN
jgi:geranylgeranyl diphosphate synthase type II